MEMGRRIGITATVPVEVLLAAGYQPLDLNNLFINDPDPERLLGIAERDGFPQNCCSWIKGIYAVCMERGIDTVLCVTSGDCSNTLMLMEVLKLKGLETVPFAFPEEPDPGRMRQCLESLAQRLGTGLASAEGMRTRLKNSRRLAHRLDELTWRQGRVSGWENHLWLVSSSDFNGDFQAYEQGLAQVVAQAERRSPYPDDMLRLAYIGVPAVFARDLYPFVERYGARVVFNETQRQFAMPRPGKSLAEQYSHYTYPYPLIHRIADIRRELRRRRVDGVIHYVQAFCHRGIADIVFRHAIDLPMLTVEGNDEFTLSQHLRTRLEAFLDLLRRSPRPQGAAAPKSR